MICVSRLYLMGDVDDEVGGSSGVGDGDIRAD